MKKYILVLIVVIIVYLTSFFYFKGFLIGFKDGYPVVYTHVISRVDNFPEENFWYKRYFDNRNIIVRDECPKIGGSPKLVGPKGFVDGTTWVQVYHGCEVK